MNTFTKTEVFLSVFVQKRSSVNGALDEKITFGLITHLVDPEIRTMLVQGMLGNKNSTFHSGPRFTIH